MDRSVNPKNHDGLYTLHGGNFGYDQRNWTVTAYTSSSVTFALYDNAAEGFPGDIVTHTTYTVDSKRTADNPQGSPRLVTELVSLALTESTPIMLSNHIYWNLNAFKQPTILDDTWLQLPISRRFIETDSNQIPTGVIAAVEDSDHSSMDFTVGKTIGQDIPYTEGLCGPGCIGYDHCFIIDRDPLYAAANVNLVPGLRWHSSTTGISMEVATNQPSIRVFTCLNMDGTVPVKPSQVERNGKDKEAAEFVEKYGCLAIEPEGWMILSTILNGARTLSTLPGTFQPLTTPLTLSVLSEAENHPLSADENLTHDQTEASAEDVPDIPMEIYGRNLGLWDMDYRELSVDMRVALRARTRIPRCQARNRNQARLPERLGLVFAPPSKRSKRALKCISQHFSQELREDKGKI
ncbi:hypothetical protein CNMCM8980_002444 [Aspergillus fumigatiaffinis]|nr:hypothetical protein CNMCM8980_002444 [Aspergillus fumigatiaffinis]